MFYVFSISHNSNNNIILYIFVRIQWSKWGRTVGDAITPLLLVLTNLLATVRTKILKNKLFSSVA